LIVEIVGMAELLNAILESGLAYDKETEFETEDGVAHKVDLVVRDEHGTKVGVKVDEKTGRAHFVGHEDEAQRGTSVVQRIAQRYAYSKTLGELKRKGYEIAKEERQADGTIKVVAQRWRG
jgi:hypothetical protein